MAVRVPGIIQLVNQRLRPDTDHKIIIRMNSISARSCRILCYLLAILCVAGVVAVMHACKEGWTLTAYYKKNQPTILRPYQQAAMDDALIGVGGGQNRKGTVETQAVTKKKYWLLGEFREHGQANTEEPSAWENKIHRQVRRDASARIPGHESVAIGKTMKEKHVTLHKNFDKDEREENATRFRAELVKGCSRADSVNEQKHNTEDKSHARPIQTRASPCSMDNASNDPRDKVLALIAEDHLLGVPPGLP